MRMAKNFFEIEDNVIEKKLLIRAITDYGPTFMPQKQVKILDLQKGIEEFYAQVFLNGDVGKAKRILTTPKTEIRKNELAWICFNTGIMVAEFIIFLRDVLSPV